ncbi:hypothetical protein GCM10027020_01570 [Nocardioides salsibiostraticola]
MSSLSAELRNCFPVATSTPTAEYAVPREDPVKMRAVRELVFRGTPEMFPGKTSTRTAEAWDRGLVKIPGWDPVAS